MASPKSASVPEVFGPQMLFDYNRTVIGYHGTRTRTAKQLIAGGPFSASTNDDDWLGHGVYFWEYGPQQAWWWAERRYGPDAAVVGAMIRLGTCLDLLDPSNTHLLRTAHGELEMILQAAGQSLPNNANTHKYRDCAVFNYLYKKMVKAGFAFESSRAVFVPMRVNKGFVRLWERSGVIEGAHIQLCVRETSNILAVWSVKRDGRYGEEAL